jgi:HAE1 family hydrophobic/amphiphilic exporter-1
VDVGTTSQGGKPELAVQIDRDRAAELGVPVAMVAMTLRTLLAGEKISDLKLDGERVDIRLRVEKSFGRTNGQIASIKARAASGQLVELGNVVRLGEGTGPTQIERTNRQRKITVLANVEGLALGAAMNQVEALAAEVVPPGQSTKWEGISDMLGESFRSMGQALVLAVILVYLILAAQFESWIHPLTIMLSLPFIVIGAFGALYLIGYNLSIFAFIGLIMLVGLVTKNAVLLVDYTNTLRGRGMGMIEALLQAGPVRLRPILMTTAAMIFGMLPVALGRSIGGELRAPMAVAVIGGLITSTMLTLVVVPVVYALLDRLRVGKREKAQPASAPVPAER